MNCPVLSILAVDGLPDIGRGDDLPSLLVPPLTDLIWPDGRQGLLDGDILVVASKIVSKAEGRIIDVEDREKAIDSETVRLVASVTRDGQTIKIVENRQGLVMAAAGVDASNTVPGTVLLLPVDPDLSAQRLRTELQSQLGVKLGVIITDTTGRPWRIGQVDLAIGAAGIRVVEDLRGQMDSHGRVLSVTNTAVADEIASAAQLVTGKVSGRPVAAVRGLAHLVVDDAGAGARSMQRPAAEDLFRQGTAEAYDEGLSARGMPGSKPGLPT